MSEIEARGNHLLEGIEARRRVLDPARDRVWSWNDSEGRRR